jgi:glycosyltransferase involved in cell wall biosynthesis
VEVVVTAESQPAEESYPVCWVRRAAPPGIRHAQALAAVASHARRADVVYSTGMFGRSSLGTFLAGAPLVVKLTADPAFERARRWGLVSGEVTEFQQRGGGQRSRLLRAGRDRAVGRAAHVVCPSAFMRRLVLSWGVPSERVDVLPNPAPQREEAEPYDIGEHPVLAFAGRLTDQKNLDLALDALRDVRLVVAGDGPERERLAARAGANVTFAGPLPRRSALGLLAAADASVLTSDWENFPHGVVESLAMGTPVIATRTGGVAEIVRDGENGLLVAPGDLEGFRTAVERYLSDDALRERLRANAAPSVARFDRTAVFSRLERILEQAAS